MDRIKSGDLKVKPRSYQGLGAGKGDLRRPEASSVYRENYDRIFPSKGERCEQTEMPLE